MQLRLECKELDGDRQRVIRSAGENPDPIATCTVVRFGDGYATVFAESFEPVDLDPARCFEDTAAAAETVGRGRAVHVGEFSTYVFVRQPDLSDPAVVRKAREDYAVVVDGREVSWASSSRSNDEAAELWVRTEEDSRGHGYAQRAAHAWAAEVTSEGRVAFYSHLRGNAPSRQLAAKLGVLHVFDLVSFTIDE